jgi:hypothetical protein
MKYIVILLTVAVMLASCSSKAKQEREGAISLFNGKNLDGWVVKIKGYDLNDNFANTFRAEDGILKVGYDGYDKFDNRFGHIYYKVPYSDYRLKVEYRFTGDQLKDGPSWAFRNSGIMFHCQEPGSILKDQDFPVCIEAQFLGGDGVSERSTLNVCSPGTHIVMNDSLIKQHCNSSSSKTFHGDVWVTAELIVYHDSLIYHLVNGDTVLTYSKPQIGGDLPEGFPLPEGSPLTSGDIALQSESHPVEFRNVLLFDLSKKKK